MKRIAIFAAVLALASAHAHAFSIGFCDDVATKFNVTATLKERGASEFEALQIAEMSRAGQTEMSANRAVIKQVYEFPRYQGLTRAQIVQKAKAECRALN